RNDRGAGEAAVRSGTRAGGEGRCRARSGGARGHGETGAPGGRGDRAHGHRRGRLGAPWTEGKPRSVPQARSDRLIFPAPPARVAFTMDIVTRVWHASLDDAVVARCAGL